MALEIPPSSYSIKNYLIFGLLALGFAVWFANDGYNPNSKYHQEQLEKGEGQPTIDLRVNQVAPFFLGAFALYNFVSMGRLRKRRVVADETGLTVDGKQEVSYSAITKLDRRYFEEKGFFDLYIQQNGPERKIRFSDKHYDKLGLLLDEIIRQTGAAPAAPAEEPS